MKNYINLSKHFMLHCTCSVNLWFTFFPFFVKYTLLYQNSCSCNNKRFCNSTRKCLYYTFAVTRFSHKHEPVARVLLISDFIIVSRPPFSSGTENSIRWKAPRKRYRNTGETWCCPEIYWACVPGISGQLLYCGRV